MPDTATLAYTAIAGLTFAALYVGHLAGDHALQRSEWAVTKGEHSHAGRAACAQHVVVLTLAQMVALAVVALATQQGYLPVAVLAGLAVNAWSHYWFDRRCTAHGLYAALGKAEFAATGQAPLATGAYRMDQDWHTCWLLPVALIIAAPTLAHIAVLTTISAAVMALAITVSRRHRTRTPEAALAA